MAAIKVIIPSGNYDNLDAVENTIKYAMRLDNMGLIGGYGVVLSNEDGIAEQFHIVKEVYNKTTGKQVIHIVFSVDGKCFLKPEHVKKLGYLLGNAFGRERQVLFGVHDDTKHLHIHMVINTIAFTNGAYCGYIDIGWLNQYAGACLQQIMNEVWFGK